MENTGFKDACLKIGCDITESGWPDKFGTTIRQAIAQADDSKAPIKVLSLFSGAGGLDIGFHDAGFDIVESVEIEKKFCATLEQNSGPGRYFEGTKVNNLDIRKYQPTLKHVDFIIGGPPCQTFSAAGRRANGVLGTTDARGMLFREYARLLHELDPKGFLFENVYGIVGAQGGEPWREILRYFSNAGYQLHYRILDAADFGAPQHRERLIIVGLKEGNYLFPKPVFGPDSPDAAPFYTAAQAIKTAPLGPDGIPPVIGGRYGQLIPEIPPGLNYSYYTEKMGNPKAIFAWRSKFSDFMYKADPDTPVRTVKAQGGQYTGPFHWENRHFSVAEFKRLQTFPDSYDIAGGRQVQIQQIGNSVPPQLARMLALSVRSQVFGRELPLALETLAPNAELGFRKRKQKLTKEYQAKAKAALADANKASTVRFSLDSYTATLGDDFRFSRETGAAGRYSVTQDKNNGALEVKVVDTASPASTDFELVIKPNETWVLPFSRICGLATGDDPLTLTVLWKAIERTIVDAGAKADLVQLSGYYQYGAQIICELNVKGACDCAAVLANITNGVASRQMVTVEELSQKLGVKPEQVQSTAVLLRRLGYEIRNRNTNSQIPEGYWLIPYEFPTLTPLSIQLRKQV